MEERKQSGHLAAGPRVNISRGLDRRSAVDYSQVYQIKESAVYIYKKITSSFRLVVIYALGHISRLHADRYRFAVDENKAAI